MKKNISTNKSAIPVNKNKPVIIVYSYGWIDKSSKKSKSKKSGLHVPGYKIFKKIESMTNNKLKNDNVKYDFRRLRVSAGNWAFPEIHKKLLESDIVIIDISKHNPNVLIELGMALSMVETNGAKKIYVIKDSADKNKMPSNIHSLFITSYTWNKDKVKVTFNDQNSMREGIVHQIKKIYDIKNPNPPI
jgi:hypothetical protein